MMGGPAQVRSLLLGLALAIAAADPAASSSPLSPVTAQGSQGTALVERLRGGRFILFFAMRTPQACRVTAHTGSETEKDNEISLLKAGSSLVASARS